jgi:hypothetical protein
MPSSSVSKNPTEHWDLPAWTSRFGKSRERKEFGECEMKVVSCS